MPPTTDLVIPSAWNMAGRTALVTGAGSASGIGFAAARMLGELGSRVIVTATTDRVMQRVADLTRLGITATGIACTLDTEAGAKVLAERLAEERLAPTILVNNAGMVAVGDAQMPHGDIDTSAAEWDHGLAINLSTAFHATRTVIGHMREAQWGRIVTVSSVSGPFMASRGDIAYATAKAGLVGFTRALAVDEARHGITACERRGRGRTGAGRPKRHAGRGRLRDRLARVSRRLLCDRADHCRRWWQHRG